MHAFSVAPFDQNLSIDGKGLTDDSATLGSLGVVPESIICLKVAHQTQQQSRDIREVVESGSLLLLFHRRMSRCQTTPPWTTCIRVSVETVTPTQAFYVADAGSSSFTVGMPEEGFKGEHSFPDTPPNLFVFEIHPNVN